MNLRKGGTGFLAACVELTGAKQVQVQEDYANQNAWRWIISWK